MTSPFELLGKLFDFPLALILLVSSVVFGLYLSWQAFKEKNNGRGAIILLATAIGTYYIWGFLATAQNILVN